MELSFVLKRITVIFNRSIDSKLTGYLLRQASDLFVQSGPNRLGRRQRALDVIGARDMWIHHSTFNRVRASIHTCRAPLILQRQHVIIESYCRFLLAYRYNLRVKAILEQFSSFFVGITIQLGEATVQLPALIYGLLLQN